MRSRKKGNCAAVADLRLEYDFHTKTWLAEFVAGEHNGVTKEFAIASFSKEVWDKMSLEGFADVIKDYATATQGDKKKMAKEFLIKWCVALLRKEEDVFLKQWPLEPTQELQTPIKSRRSPKL